MILFCHVRKTCTAMALAFLVAGPAPAQNTAALFEVLCGRTLHYFDPVGNQIEYTSADGVAYLWYPDRDDVIIGAWRIDEQIDLREGSSGLPFAVVCYSYPPGSFGPQYVGDEFCFGEGELYETVVPDGVFDGDRYGLTDGVPPFRLPELPRIPLEAFEQDFPILPPEPTCGAVLS